MEDKTPCLSYEEYKAKRLTNTERMSIMHMDMLQRSIGESVDGIRNRLAVTGYKYINRDIGMINSAMKRMCDAVLRSTTVENVNMILRQSKDMKLGLVRATIVKDPSEVVMPVSDEFQFVSLVLEGNCAICFKKDGECRMCGVRKLLRKYVDEPDPGTLSGCGFQGNALRNTGIVNEDTRRKK